MSPEQAPIAAVALIVLTALLVGFQSVSTLLTVTQLGAESDQRTGAEVARLAGAAAAGPDDQAGRAESC